jgi:hypothetical protein
VKYLIGIYEDTGKEDDPQFDTANPIYGQMFIDLDVRKVIKFLNEMPKKRIKKAALIVDELPRTEG